MENINKLKKKYLITKILIFLKLPNPIRETRGFKLVFITIFSISSETLWYGGDSSLIYLVL